MSVLEWLGAKRYMEHAICLTNDPILMALYFAGDMIIFLSYFVIGGVLLAHFVSGLDKIHIPYPLQVLFGAFIFLCGLTHLTKTLTLFVGIYRLDIMIVAATSAVSAVTAILLIKTMKDTT